MNRYTKVSRAALLRVFYAPMQVAIGAILFAEPHRIYSVAELADILYGDRDDGGPDDPPNIIKGVIFRMRQHGFPIATHGWRGYSYEPSERHAHE